MTAVNNTYSFTVEVCATISIVVVLVRQEIGMKQITSKLAYLQRKVQSPTGIIDCLDVWCSCPVMIISWSKCKFADCSASSYVPWIRYRIPCAAMEGRYISIYKPSAVLKSETGLLLLLILYKLLYYRGHMSRTCAWLKSINLTHDARMIHSVTVLARDSILYFLLIFGTCSFSASTYVLILKSGHSRSGNQHRAIAFQFHFVSRA